MSGLARSTVTKTRQTCPLESTVACQNNPPSTLEGSSLTMLAVCEETCQWTQMMDRYYVATDSKQGDAMDSVTLTTRSSLTWHFPCEWRWRRRWSLPAQESYNEAHQQNAQPLHYLPAGTNILALWGVFWCLVTTKYNELYQLSALTTSETHDCYFFIVCLPIIYTRKLLVFI